MATQNLERSLLTTVETAKKIGYTIQHTRLLIRRHKLPAQKVGRDWLILESDLHAYVDEARRVRGADALMQSLEKRKTLERGGR